MSAWIVTKDHITALLAGWQHYLSPTEKKTKEDLTELGKVLWRENCISVAFRYDEPTDNCWESYKFPAKYLNNAPITDFVVLFKLIDCLDYQSCEHEGWNTSKAYYGLVQIRERLGMAMPGYDQAPWGLDSIAEYEPKPAPEPKPIKHLSEPLRLTPRDALCIQARDIVWYGDRYPGGEDALRAAVKAKTNLVGLHKDQPYDIILINERIPRGGAIEAMCGIDAGGN